MTDSHRLDSHGLDDAPADGDGDPARRAEARDAAARVRVAAAALPESQQEALRLKVQHGLRYADIAEVMRVTPGHVAVLVHRAVSALRQRLGAPPQRAPAQGGSS